MSVESTSALPVAGPEPTAGEGLLSRPVPELIAAPERYHAMDALRALAMLLGIVFHAALAFDPNRQNWAVIDPGANPYAAGFAVVSHSFRLPIFFVIAGFFARLTFARRGLVPLIATRTRRILIPFVVGWFLFRPLIAMVWIWGAAEHRGAGALGLAARRAAAGFVESLASPERLFVGTHLWFLYYLALVYAGVLCLRGCASWWSAHVADLRAPVDAVLRRCLTSRGAIVLAALPTTALLLGMQRLGIDTPDDSLAPRWPVLLLYGALFALGWTLHRQPGLLAELGLRWRQHVVAAIVLTLPVLVVTHVRPAVVQPWHVVVARGAYALMMWAWILGVMGVVLRTFDRPSRGWRYVADSTYWLYLAHLPLVAGLQVLFVDVVLHWSLKLALNLAITLPLLLVSYHLLVRSTLVGHVMHGRRFPTRWRLRREP